MGCLCFLAAPLMAVTCNCLPDAGTVACSVRDAAQAAIDFALERAQPLDVKLDFSRILRLDAAPDTVAIGNADIVDVSFADARTIVLSGRAPGTTNLIVLNAEGELVETRTVRVTQSFEGLTTVLRGVVQHTYRCGASCAPVATVSGDADLPTVATDQVGAVTGN